MSPGAWIPAAERDLNVSRRVGRDRREGFKCLPAAGYRLPREGSRSPSASHAIARSSSSSSGSRPPPSRYGWATVLLDDLLRLTVGPAPVTLSVQKPLGELEATVLAALWSSPSPLSAREVLALVQRTRARLHDGPHGAGSAPRQGAGPPREGGESVPLPTARVEGGGASTHRQWLAERVHDWRALADDRGGSPPLQRALGRGAASCPPPRAGPRPAARRAHRCSTSW